MERSRYPQERLVRECDLAFLEAEDIPGEAHLFEEGQECWFVMPDLFEVGKLGIGEDETLEIIHGWLQTGHQHETASERIGAHVKIEGRDVPVCWPFHAMYAASRW